LAFFIWGRIKKRYITKNNNIIGKKLCICSIEIFSIPNNYLEVGVFIGATAPPALGVTKALIVKVSVPALVLVVSVTVLLTWF
jgi:hypothetical protein